MPLPFPVESLERVRSASRRLATQAAATVNELNGLLTTTQLDFRDAQSALASASVAPDSADVLAAAVRVHASRSAVAVETVRRLCLSARQHLLATSRMVNELCDPADASSI